MNAPDNQPVAAAAEQEVPQQLLATLRQEAAAHYPEWANNEHPDARGYNAYQLGALAEYQRHASAAGESAAEGYEKLRQALTKYVACNEATENEVFLRLRGKRSWTRAEFVQELRDNGPEALDMMVSLLATAAHFVTKDKHFPAPVVTVPPAVPTPPTIEVSRLQELIKLQAASSHGLLTVDIDEERLPMVFLRDAAGEIQASLNWVDSDGTNPLADFIAAARHFDFVTLEEGAALRATIVQLVGRLDLLAGDVFAEFPLPWEATTSYPPYISVPAAGEKGRHHKVVDGLNRNEARFITELVNAWPQLCGGQVGVVANPAAWEPGSKAPLAQREAARDLCYALRDLGPLDTGAADHAARKLILAAFAQVGAPAFD